MNGLVRIWAALLAITLGLILIAIALGFNTSFSCKLCHLTLLTTLSWPELLILFSCCNPLSTQVFVSFYRKIYAGFSIFILLFGSRTRIYLFENCITNLINTVC